MGIARQLGLSEEELDRLHHGSLLHDIGKIGVYDRILLKPKELNAEEFEVMKSHPQYGAEILKGSTYFQKHIPIILHHHERMDGKGYPLGLKGDEIPLGARICQVADAWDAMASDRPYRRRLDFNTCVQRLREAVGTQLDPLCVEAFLDWKSSSASPNSSI
jgi:HD-GYP domain-containing protein (c-di-GMP phosphodiesterase class II)